MDDALDSLGTLDEPTPNSFLLLVAELADSVAIDLEKAGIPATMTRVAESIFRAGA